MNRRARGKKQCGELVFLEGIPHYSTPWSTDGWPGPASAPLKRIPVRPGSEATVGSRQGLGAIKTKRKEKPFPSRGIGGKRRRAQGEDGKRDARTSFFFLTL